MPELTIVNMQECTHNYGIFTISKYQVTISPESFVDCTCPDYIYRRRNKNEFCKHILEVYNKVCGWHEQFGEHQTKKQKEKYICPRCGGKTRAVRVGV